MALKSIVRISNIEFVHLNLSFTHSSPIKSIWWLKDWQICIKMCRINWFISLATTLDYIQKTQLFTTLKWDQYFDLYNKHFKNLKMYEKRPIDVFRKLYSNKLGRFQLIITTSRIIYLQRINSNQKLTKLNLYLKIFFLNTGK